MTIHASKQDSEWSALECLGRAAFRGLSKTGMHLSSGAITGLARCCSPRDRMPAQSARQSNPVPAGAAQLLPMPSVVLAASAPLGAARPLLAPAGGCKGLLRSSSASSRTWRSASSSSASLGVGRGCACLVRHTNHSLLRKLRSASYSSVSSAAARACQAQMARPIQATPFAPQAFHYVPLL
jgi:hypothetical protein